MSKLAAQAQAGLLEGEPAWYALPNGCATIVWRPAGVELAEGERRAVTAQVQTTDGGAAAESRFAVTGIERGRFSADTAEGGPGTPARFTATAAAADDGGTTVFATVIATSRAGRARAQWRASSDEVKAPPRFTGTVSATTSGHQRDAWTGTGTWTRTDVQRSGDGSVTVWYELTSATVTTAESHLGDGCHWLAHAAGGELQSGDVELRILPDGRRQYAFLYEVSVPAAYHATDCPPGEELPSFESLISARLDSRSPGGTSVFRPVPADWRLEAQGATDVTGPLFGATTGSWSLAPG
jgi:hypothetical protein